MRILHISDTHGKHVGLHLSEADVPVLSGDFTQKVEWSEASCFSGILQEMCETAMPCR